MRPKTAASAAILLIALATSASAGAGSNASPWKPGDAVSYDVTVELQQHTVPKHGSGAKETTTESTSSGIAMFTVSGVASSGAAQAKAYYVFQGSSAGKVAMMNRSLPATIGPNGDIMTVGLQGSAIATAFDLANGIIREAKARNARPGTSWQSTGALSGIGARMTFARAADAMRPYLGFNALEILTSGDASLQSDTQSGKISIAGSVYYDTVDRVFVGESVRSFTLLVNTAGGHVESTATINIALRSLARTTPAPATPAPPVVTTPTPIPARTKVPMSAVTPIPGATGAPTTNPANLGPPAVNVGPTFVPAATPTPTP